MFLLARRNYLAITVSNDNLGECITVNGQRDNIPFKGFLDLSKAGSHKRCTFPCSAWKLNKTDSWNYIDGSKATGVLVDGGVKALLKNGRTFV